MRALVFCACVCALIVCVFQSLAAAPPPVDERPDERISLCAQQKLRMYPPLGYIGLYADAGHSVCRVDPAAYAMFEMWVWILPGTAGVKCAEFRIGYPATYLGMTVTSNPGISVAQGDLSSGMSVCMNECQTDWFWTHHQTIFCMGPVPGALTLIPHPTAGGPQVANCADGYPIEPIVIFNHLHLLEPCGCAIVPIVSKLTAVLVEGPSTLRAMFDHSANLHYSADRHFFLWEKANPTDTIRCIAAEYSQGSDMEFILDFGKQLTDDTVYILEAYDILGPDSTYATSQFEFTFHQAATLLQSCSATLRDAGIEVAWELSSIDEGMAFAIARSTDGGEFLALDPSGIASDGLRFTYLDSRVEPGTKYVYRVEYAVGGRSGVLFISEAIETPAATLALLQNHPNPFNPSTIIEYVLPAECSVTLDIFDTSGKLVARLVDREMQAKGRQSATWLGLDGAGRPVASGIYYYRLRAGVETISRKMVLLR